MQTIVELPEFIKKPSELLNDNEKTEIINYLAAHPKAGVQSIPLFLLTVFGKNQKENLTKSERNDLAKFTEQLVKNYGEQDV